MREKYVEEEFPRYFIFGEWDDGVHVDVSDGEGDVVTHVVRSQAVAFIQQRDRLVDEVVSLLLERFNGEPYTGVFAGWTRHDH